MFSSHRDSLHAKLIDFGLDPREWRLGPRTRVGGVSHFHIQSLRGAWQFEGWAVDGRWLSLAITEV